MDLQEILKFLPHRYPFLLVDKVIDLVVNQSIVAIKNITINEHFFAGHFPAKPVMPGVLIIEALAQSAAILGYKSIAATPQNSLFYIGAIDKTRFKKIIVPVDQLHLHVEVIKHKNPVWKFYAKAIVADQITCTTELTCMEGPIA